ncbi:ankyrin repeat domain-containing protein [Enterococcus sp. DIV1298c]|uniref:Ankyrin repeat domain-containing protein n=1 Tax=Candidatus Enterococcus mangumiae TaxID=2230878 RepID=A0ABZ2SZN1_9ENTE|nr:MULTISPECIES: ankyrin repeat domain-containing protein [unclassified Enterococcus]MBO0462169.1 ankyrin repeat domain-containing protein [Enterococcus sp. DIV1298c]MBO0489532.1 ankyrin repeat domain-containing protein [Enterococcus sp. DIV1094]
MKVWLILPFTISLFLLSGCEDPQEMPNPEQQEKATSTSMIEESTTEETTTEQTNHVIEETEESLVNYPSGSLLTAVEGNDRKQVEEILQTDYSIDEQNEKGETPLLIATHHNFVDIAKLLIDHGASIDIQDEIQDSPYLYAGAQGKTEILAYMLEHREPNQEIVNRFGGNALIPAAEKGHLENVKLLLTDARVDIDHQNNYGYTALIEAVALRDGSEIYQQIVQELLNHGADKTLRDNQGKTAEDYARELGYTQLLSQLTK